MRGSTVLLWVLLAVGAFGSFDSRLAALAQDKQEPKKEQDPPKKEEIEATLVAFKGTVDVKRPEDKDWVAAERNMKLKKGSEVCTAVASTATLLFTGNVKVDVKALTQAKIEDLAKAGQKLNADVKLKFGSVEVDIQKGDLRTDMKVTAPNSTTSVSGSQGIVRAPAAWGSGASISLTTFSGSWSHEAGGVSRSIEGAGLANNLHDLPRDLQYFANTHEFTDYGGRRGDELYRGRFAGKAGEFNSDDVPFGDRANRWPTSDKHRKPGILPPPPPPP